MNQNRPTYQLSFIPDGVAGIRATLRTMHRVTKSYKTHPLIRELALQIVRNVPEHSAYAEARAVLKFVQNSIRYVNDIAGVETIQTPDQTLRIGQGDCDDKSILFGSLMQAIGKPIRYVAIGTVKGRFEHVLPQVKIGDKWLTAETIYKWPLGKNPPHFADYIVEHVR